MQHIADQGLSPNLDMLRLSRNGFVVCPGFQNYSEWLMLPEVTIAANDSL
jgi:hypothetical protein